MELGSNTRTELPDALRASMAELADLMSKPMRLLVETEQVADAKESIRDFKVFDTYRPSAPLPFILAGGAPYACSQDVDATSKNRTYSLKKETSSQYFNRLKRWRSAARCPTPAAPRERITHTPSIRTELGCPFYKIRTRSTPQRGPFPHQINPKSRYIRRRISTVG